MTGRAAGPGAAPDLSVLILARNERDNIGALVPRLRRVTGALGIETEVVVVDASTDGTAERAAELGCRVVTQRERGYGAAFRQGIDAVRGRFVLAIDADHSHEPEFLAHMWAVRSSADVVIGSRYVPAGRAEMTFARRILSRALNAFFAAVLRLPYRDMSSAYRLYHRSVLESVMPLRGRNFDVLQEALVKAYCQGWRIREVPISYRPRHQGRSNASALRFAAAYVRTLGRLWRLRNSVSACDYDARAFASWLLPQRYWQRRRFAIITALVRGHARALDIGCGSSQIIRSLPAMVGMEISPAKIRFLRATNPRLVQGTAHALPFRDEAFSAVVCSEVIEHIPKSPALFEEMHRVLEPGGTLVLGTPDYASRLWHVIEYWYTRLLPDAYGEEHIAHYTRAELLETLAKFGFAVTTVHDILRCELIVEAVKGETVTSAGRR